MNYYFVVKENKEEKIDKVLSHLEKSLNFDINNEQAQILIINILIFFKKLYDKGLEKKIII